MPGDEAIKKTLDDLGDIFAKVSIKDARDLMGPDAGADRGALGAKRDAKGGVRGGQGRLPMTEENCENCRYWSELVVKCQGAGHEIQALCLNQKGPFHAR